MSFYCSCLLPTLSYTLYKIMSSIVMSLIVFVDMPEFNIFLYYKNVYLMAIHITLHSIKVHHFILNIIRLPI